MSRALKADGRQSFGVLKVKVSRSRAVKGAARFQILDPEPRPIFPACHTWASLHSARIRLSFAGRSQLSVEARFGSNPGLIGRL